MMERLASDLDHARLRSAGKELLSLALIDARNRTLAWAAAFEATSGERMLCLPSEAPLAGEIDPPLWTLGHCAWFQELWIGRNVQRSRGEGAEPRPARLASILPGADAWYDPAACARSARHALAASDLPDAVATRQYLVESLESSLDMLDALRDESDDALYFHRLALFHEAMHIEGFAVLAQSAGLAVPAGLLPRCASFASRPPLLFPATRWLLGVGASGFRFDNEREAHPVAIPEFEIDAQAVTWAQFGEFVEDGGYDDASHWSDEGWAWVGRQARRTPRHVDQIRHGVLQHRFGRLARVPQGEPAVHLSWYEADAWCRWAGRRLPGEAEWEAAAHQGASRGFRFGDVWEWTASTFRPYPGFVPGPWREYSQASFGHAKALRGASFATPLALRGPRFRKFEAPGRDDGFFGFRSCAA
jgi:gamma-glutamyl hercynylcysteine S-oxide synthase